MKGKESKEEIDEWMLVSKKRKGKERKGKGRKER